MSKRAERRHHLERKKRNAKPWVARQMGTSEPTDKQIGRRVATPAICSCYMCGNPRRFFDEATRQEQVVAAAEHDHDI